MNFNWSEYRDADTEDGLARYQKDRLTLNDPSTILRKSARALHETVTACSHLLDATYNGNYPSSTKEISELQASITSSNTHLFTLSLDGQIIATASIVNRSNGMNGQLKFVELSKAAKHPDMQSSRVSVRHLSKYRIPWAFENLDVDFLYGSPRVAAVGKDGSPGGKQAQSVWWGGRRQGTNLPLATTNIGWNFRIGGIEPLTGFIIPTDALRWADAVRQLPVYLPDKSTLGLLHTLFYEGTNGAVAPQLLLSLQSGMCEPTFRQARPPSADIISKYYISELATHLHECTADEVDASLSDAIGQKTIIESDVASTSSGAQIMRYLIHVGWTFVGWQPSEVTYGGICPVFSRVNPHYVHELIEPKHHREYFDDSGLKLTRQALDGMYVKLRANARLNHA